MWLLNTNKNLLISQIDKKTISRMQFKSFIIHESILTPFSLFKPYIFCQRFFCVCKRPWSRQSSDISLWPVSQHQPTESRTHYPQLCPTSCVHHVCSNAQDTEVDLVGTLYYNPSYEMLDRSRSGSHWPRMAAKIDIQLAFFHLMIAFFFGTIK